MMTIRVGGRSITLVEPDEYAQYAAVDRLRAAAPAGGNSAEAQPVRLAVDLERNYGGLASRAMLGGRFIPRPGVETLYEVFVGRSFDELSLAHANRFEARPINNERCVSSLIPVLPQEFGRAVLQEMLSDQWCPVTVPPGIFVIDRAGFDEQGSSSAIFELAARTLKCLVLTRIAGGDLEAEGRRLIALW